MALLKYGECRQSCPLGAKPVWSGEGGGGGGTKSTILTCKLRCAKGKKGLLYTIHVFAKLFLKNQWIVELPALVCFIHTQIRFKFPMACHDANFDFCQVFEMIKITFTGPSLFWNTYTCMTPTLLHTCRAIKQTEDEQYCTLTCQFQTETFNYSKNKCYIYK